MCFDLSNNSASFVEQFRWQVRPKRKFQASFCAICGILCNFAACETSLKERFTLLSNKNPPERDVFKGKFLTCGTFFSSNHAIQPIDRMTLLLALSTTEESSKAR